MTTHDDKVTAIRQRRFLDEAQHAAAPELADLEALLERIASYAPKFAAPLEPSGPELDELNAAMLEEWRAGRDARAVVDKFQHPWLTPERRQGFTAAQYTRAQTALHDELNAATAPNDGQIVYLDAVLQEAVSDLLKRPDANGRELFAATHAQLIGAWHGVFMKLIHRVGPIRLTAAHLVANSDEVRLAEDVTGLPQHRLGEPLAILTAEHGARPWLPTPSQYEAELERLSEEVEPTPPKPSGRVRSAKA